MKCPNCNVSLVITDRSNVEIDYCPECRGIWLDRGELDKIIERSSQSDQRAQSRGYGNTHTKGREQDHDHGPKKKDSFLSDIFDF